MLRTPGKARTGDILDTDTRWNFPVLCRDVAKFVQLELCSVVDSPELPPFYICFPQESGRTVELDVCSFFYWFRRFLAISTEGFVRFLVSPFALVKKLSSNSESLTLAALNLRGVLLS